uniref:Uncharacterized protein n=1 Tax=mine drainage metagenome TaxID=410659 RepID=E6Q5V7_9ZZZZ
MLALDTAASQPTRADKGYSG